MSTEPRDTSSLPAADDPSSREPSGSHHRATFTRSRLACNDCRRMKVRCMREGNEPCSRCQHLKLECIIAKVTDGTRPRESWGRSKRTHSVESSSPGVHEPEGQSDWRAAKRRMLMLEEQLDLLRSELGVAARYRQPIPDRLDDGDPRPLEFPRPSHPKPPIYSQPQYDEDDHEAVALGRSEPSSPPRADDMLASDHLVAPFRQLRSMADEHGQSRAASHDHIDELEAAGQLQGLANVNVTGDATLAEAPTNPALTSALHAVIASAGDAQLDIVKLGIIDEGEAKQLYEYFFAHCNDFVLVHDEKVDTWDSIRSRSPLSLATIIAVAAIVRDGAGAVSDTQRNTMHLAQALVLGTVFDRRRRRLEDVQGVITVGVYHRNCWLLTGHAIRLATDMGINNAFAKLLATGMGAKSKGEQDRQLVIGARLWFALYSHDRQLSFGNGRSPVIHDDDSMLQCRRFIDHPLAIASDVRLIALVELLRLRTPLHLRLVNSSEPIIGHRFAETLQKVKFEIESWYSYYDAVMAERYHLEATGYYRESLRTQREYALLFATSLTLRGVSHPADLRRLSDEEYILALGAVRSAQTCLDIVIRGTSYPRGIRYAIPHTHISAAFAASFLLRICRLFPDRLDRRATVKDVETLVRILADCGSHRLSRALTRLLHRSGEKTKTKAAPPTDEQPNSAQSLPLEPSQDLLSAIDYFSSMQDPLGSSGTDFAFDNFWDISNLTGILPDSIAPTSDSPAFATGSSVPGVHFADSDFNTLLGDLSNFGSN